MSATAAVATEDVVYHTPAGAPLLARLYRPAGDGPFPAAVGVHGGRWCAETRLTNAAIDAALAASGVFVMALDFRMPPVARYPTPVADINLAIRWLKTRAPELHVRRDWIGGVGTSSGGHQLLLNALTPDDPRFAQDHPRGYETIDASLAFVVVGWAVSDPAARYRYALARDMAEHVRAHELYWPNEAAMSEGSPQRIVESGDAARLPPLLMIQGAADIVLTPDMADRFAAAYAAAGGEATLKTFDGQGHTFITKAPETEASRAAVEAMTIFIHAHSDRAG